MTSEMRLYACSGKRLYLNTDERRRFRQRALLATPEETFLCLVLLHTGCRLSEALALDAGSFQVGLTVSIITLKRRKPGVVREVPVPKEVFTAMRRVGKGRQDGRLLDWHRSTAWRKVSVVLADAGVCGGHAMPKGLRHGFGVNAIQCGVPLNLLSKWMGHADMKTTAIYANATGPEERRIAQRMWKSG